MGVWEIVLMVVCLGFGVIVGLLVALYLGKKSCGF